MTSRFEQHVADLRLVVTLRRIASDGVEVAARVLLDEGIRLIEIPLDTPHARESISRLATLTGKEVTVGAGTVSASEEVGAILEAGATVIVSPHCDPSIIQAARSGTGPRFRASNGEGNLPRSAIWLSDTEILPGLDRGCA